MVVHYIRCCVQNCTFKGNSRHRFPNPKKDLPRYKQWLDILGIAELFTLDPEDVYSKKRICPAHFEDKHKDVGGKRLHRNALPSIGLTEELPIPVHQSDVQFVGLLQLN